MSRSLGFAIIGMGSIGLVHFRALRHGYLPFIGFSSRKEAVLRGDFSGIQCNLGEKGVKNENIAGLQVTADYKDLLRNPDVDIVIIALPTSMHAVVIEEAMLAGKHVFTEKPACSTASSAVALIRKFAGMRNRWAVGHCLPYFPAFKWLLKTLKEEPYGVLKSLHMVRQIGRQVFYTPDELARSLGPAVDLGIHDAHLIGMALGMPQQVSSTGEFMHGFPLTLHTTFQYEGRPRVTTHCGMTTELKVGGFRHSYDAIFESATVTSDGTNVRVIKSADGSDISPRLNDISIPEVFCRELSQALFYFRAAQAVDAINPTYACRALQIVEAEVASARKYGAWTSCE